MTREKALALTSEMVHELAPEIDLDAADRGAPLGEEFDLDSFSFLTLLQMIEDRAGLDVPERDYAKLSSFDALVDYLAARAG